MTIKELALYIIEHDEKDPSCIDIEQAQHIIDMLDKNEASIPENLTAESFMTEWNSLVNAGAKPEN